MSSFSFLWLENGIAAGGRWQLEMNIFIFKLHYFLLRYNTPETVLVFEVNRKSQAPIKMPIRQGLTAQAGLESWSRAWKVKLGLKVEEVQENWEVPKSKLKPWKKNVSKPCFKVPFLTNFHDDVEVKSQWELTALLRSKMPSDFE